VYGLYPITVLYAAAFVFAARSGSKSASHIPDGARVDWRNALVGWLIGTALGTVSFWVLDRMSLVIFLVIALGGLVAITLLVAALRFSGYYRAPTRA
jgi:hypothetical protein